MRSLAMLSGSDLMRHRQWEEPLVDDEDTFDMGGPIGKDDIHDAMDRPA
ncbi:hypothetical protein AB0I30_19890 [Nocardia tengchongensis]